MIASDLSRGLWNAIADLARRSEGKREIFFVKVTKTDPLKNLIWVKDFGDKAIPLVAHTYGFAYYDTIPVGNATDGAPINTNLVRREDKTHKNANYKTKIICPSAGDLVVILDPWGAKRFPMCLGTFQSGRGFWEGE